MKVKCFRNTVLSVFVTAICLFLVSCEPLAEQEEDRALGMGSYVVKYGNNLYYYDMPSYGVADLYKYDMSSGEKELIDHLSDNGNDIIGVVNMYCIDGRIYYGKSVGDGLMSPIGIYSIDADNPKEKKTEGTVELRFPTGYSNGDITFNEFKLFKNDDLYLFADDGIYKVGEENSELIEKGITAFSISGDKAYYAKLDEDVETDTTGILCYDMQSKRTEEIVPKEKIKKFNAENTVYGNTAFVRNVLEYNGYIYFFGDAQAAPILRCKADGKGDIENITEGHIALIFRIYNNCVYFTALKDHALYSVDLNTAETTVIAQMVNTFDVFDNVIYYYAYGADENNRQLRKYDLATKEDSSI